MVFTRIRLSLLLLCLLLTAGTQYLVALDLMPGKYSFLLRKGLDKVRYALLLRQTSRIELGVLQASVFLRSSKQFMEHGEYELAKEAALKGENAISILISDYSSALSNKVNIPSGLDALIDESLISHSDIIQSLISASPAGDASVYQQVLYFSQVNASALREIRNSERTEI